MILLVDFDRVSCETTWACAGCNNVELYTAKERLMVLEVTPFMELLLTLCPRRGPARTSPPPIADLSFGLDEILAAADS